MDTFRMSDAELITLAESLGGRVTYFPMVAVQKIEALARGEYPSMSTDVDWLPLREGVDKLIARARITRNIDPLRSKPAAGSS